MDLVTCTLWLQTAQTSREGGQAACPQTPILARWPDGERWPDRRLLSVRDCVLPNGGLWGQPWPLRPRTVSPAQLLRGCGSGWTEDPPIGSPGASLSCQESMGGLRPGDALRGGAGAGGCWAGGAGPSPPGRVGSAGTLRWCRASNAPQSRCQALIFRNSPVSRQRPGRQACPEAIERTFVFRKCGGRFTHFWFFFFFFLNNRSEFYFPSKHGSVRSALLKGRLPVAWLGTCTRGGSRLASPSSCTSVERHELTYDAPHGLCSSYRVLSWGHPQPQPGALSISGESAPVAVN